MPVKIRWEDEFWHMAEHGEGLEWRDRGCRSTHRSELEALGERLQRTVARQVELIFNRLDDLEVDSRLTVLEREVDVFEEELDDLIEERVAHFTKLDDLEVEGRLTMLEQKVDVFTEELDDLIEERVAHFTKWEVQRYKDLKGQVTELQEELAACKKELTRGEGADNGHVPSVKTWEKFKYELQRQFYPDSIDDKPLTAEAERRIRKYMKEYSALMLDIPEMSERQRLCFFIDGLQQWVATELRQREPHDLASTMAIVERLEDFKQGKRPRSPRHERAKDGGDGRSKSGSPKATDDERSGDEKSKEEIAKKKKSKKKRGLLYATMDVAGKTQEALVDTGASHNFMSPRVAEWLRLKLTKDGSWFTAMNAEEQPMNGVFKNVDLRIDEWTGKADFNIIDMDELGVVLGMDFMEKSSTTRNPYCGVMMMAGKEGQPEWMIPLVSKDGADARKGITVLQLDNGSTLCYGEKQMWPRTYAVDMLTKIVTTEKFKHCLSLIHLLSC
ncbi:hypothetical protein RJ639_011492 [Escallonia herrerae]|uniref:Uncharacterized protein n=1 Tax=Escallonia herrerae TaxID=1293975 RepID=A0AA88VKR7_9ASTE|nr:hypothetical protein RJ639_011492 [Escallonia herrerae]